ncbi:hypothetical protein CfE428DRAFT_1628 [Chthoniobacter flavus Ellin428]|uniref:Uncharacterized protein n=2 Tax=Chthoniobacter flavus TaxID=191863 RepID=B4CX15_9BACT|nr:hypothetical protein CfE428DRAFT_1628 [Chthoniobacter flavus Ellin428]
MELKPGGPTQTPLEFRIHPERLPNGDIQFTFKILNHGAKFPSMVTTVLANVVIEQHSEQQVKDNPALPFRSETASPVRKLPAERSDKTMTCTFTVTPKELEDPHFSFLLTLYAETMWHGKLQPMPSADMYYAPLKNFLRH